MPPTISITPISCPAGTRLLAATISLSLALALTGCATPRLQSRVEVPAQFTSAQATLTEPEVAWWESYGDPVLTELVKRAARENRDIRIAAERVRAARAGETISRSALLPNVGAVANASSTDNGYGASARQGAPETKGASAGLSVSWELDLTGRLRAGAAAAAADAQASAEQARGVRLLVLADVASNYFTLTGAMRQLDTVKAIATAQEETLRLVTARQHVGLASPFDVERARTEASRAQAAIPPLETLIAVSRHRLAVLIGSQPADAAALAPSTRGVGIPEVRPGQPAALLERRPDLLMARAQLDAANWRRQQAKAEWFPRLFVSALFGRENLEVNGMDLGSARFGNVAGLLAMPLLDWGRTRSINEIAESAQSEALLRYEDAIVRALEDVENGLVALRDERDRSQVLNNAADSAEAALNHAQSLYQRGQIDLLPLLDAQRARLAIQISANDSQTQLQLNSIQLFKALGGGWQAFEPTSTDAPLGSATPTLISTNEE
ncbi:efflux transporter outer membrane subunit [Zobellella sp. An-6]|uniref:efflux transporter outer membrane subunit n=1 Tax=Zobellella sp. An-6 TaxID=3400218 RepID=UPI0040432D8E